jgi:tetratricopeptide repeat protein
MKHRIIVKTADAPTIDPSHLLILADQATKKDEMKPRVLTVIWVFLLSQHCLADVTDWANGNTAFQNGDFRSALQYFESARQDGQDGPAVHYNIAVCNFKIGRYVAAETGFQLVADRYPGMRGLAEYNLGLIAQRRKDSESAVDHFLDAYRLSPDDRKLRILASNRLRELEPELRTTSQWTGALGMRAGFDDNVALRDETGLPSALTTASPVADLFASIRGPYNGESGLRVDGSLYVIKNFDADEFDQSEVYAGVMYDWRSGEWRLQLGLHGSGGTLGGESFDRKAGANFQAIRYLNRNSEFGLSYVYDDVQEANTLFAGLAGSRQQLHARYRWYSGERRFSLRYRQEENDRLDPGVSPKRKLLSADYGYQPDTGWGYEGGFEYRTSRFNEMAVQRNEDLLTVNVAVTRSLGRDWLLLIDYQYSNNDSSDPVFSYDRNVMTVGTIKAF